jgi:hypothetical protein
MEQEDKIGPMLTGYERAIIDGEFKHPTLICSQCQHRWPGVENGKARCFAFPGGIPEPILLSQTRHDVPRPDLGQKNKIVFEARTEDWPPDMSV